MRAQALILGALAALCFATACAAASPYDRSVRAWTRTQDVYEEFESRAFVRATLKTKPFRRSFAAEYSEVYALNAQQRAALLEAELAEADETWVVMVALATHERAWNHLETSREVWSLRLQDAAGAWALPTEITRLDRHNPVWKRLYPYVKDQYAFYEIRFPVTGTDGARIAAKGGPLTLVLAGSPAQIRLTWVVP